MSKNDYQGIGLLQFRAEQIAKSKQRLKHEANNVRRNHRLICKKIRKIRYAENYYWNNLHCLMDGYKNQGVWRQDIEHML